MPNWVRHDLKITGPEAERTRFVAECFSKTDDGVELDFNKLIPEPEHGDEPTNFTDKPGSGDLLFVSDLAARTVLRVQLPVRSNPSQPRLFTGGAGQA